jgi:hypothetical protein
MERIGYEKKIYISEGKKWSRIKVSRMQTILAGAAEGDTIAVRSIAENLQNFVVVVVLFLCPDNSGLPYF